MIRRLRSAPSRPDARPCRAHGRPPSAAPRRAPERCRGGRRRTAGSTSAVHGPMPGTAVMRADRLVRHRAGRDASRSRPSRTASATASSAFCFGRDRPASRNTIVAGRQQRLRRQRIDEPGEAAEDRVGAGARHLLRHDDRGKAVRSPARTAAAEPRRHAGANCASRGSIAAKRVEPCGNVVDRGDPAHRRSCSVIAPHRSNPAMRRINPPHVSDEHAGLPLRAEPQWRAASRPRLFGAAQQQHGRRRVGGRFLLRIEDIDLERCTPEFEQGIYDDLAWLGLGWEKPVRRQSEHFADYAGRARPADPRGARLPGLHEPRRDPRLHLRSRDAAAAAGRAIRTACRSIPALDKELSAARAPAAHRRRHALRLAARRRRRRSARQCRAAVVARILRRGHGRRQRGSRPVPSTGATSCSPARTCRPATTCRSSSTTRCKASPTSCAAATSTRRPRSSGCCRTCLDCLARLFPPPADPRAGRAQAVQELPRHRLAQPARSRQVAGRHPPAGRPRVTRSSGHDRGEPRPELASPQGRSRGDRQKPDALTCAGRP